MAKIDVCLAQEAKVRDTEVKLNAIRFNSVTNRFERWNGTEWESITIVPDPLDPDPINPDFTGLSVVSALLNITYSTTAEPEPIYPLDPDFTGLSVVSGKLCITYMVEA